MVFFAYIGFDAVSTAAQEAKNPQKDMPIGILLSLGICTLLYILMALVMTGLTPYTNLNVPHPVYVAIAAAGPGLKWLTYFINIGAIAGLASVVLVMLMGQPRVFFSMSKDGLLPPVFAKVHPKFQTPYVTTIATGVVAGIVAGIFPIGLLGELVSIGTLLAFVIVCFGVIVLRRRSPDLPRPFKTPLVPLVPILGIAICGVHDVGAPGGHVGPADRVDGDRTRDLLRLQPLAFEDRQRRGRVTAHRIIFGAASAVSRGRRFAFTPA